MTNKLSLFSENSFYPAQCGYHFIGKVEFNSNEMPIFQMRQILHFFFRKNTFLNFLLGSSKMLKLSKSIFLAIFSTFSLQNTLKVAK